MCGGISESAHGTRKEMSGSLSFCDRKCQVGQRPPVRIECPAHQSIPDKVLRQACSSAHRYLHS
jgi:hypothetical protein